MVTRLKDVAQRARVSICTVSKILNGAPGSQAYSRATAERVWQAAHELGYQPNYHARSLQAGHSQAIGVIQSRVPPGTSGGWFAAAMLSAADLAVRARGYHSVLIGTQDGQTAPERGLRFLQERTIDGLVVPGFFFEDAKAAAALEESGFAVAVVFPTFDTSLPTVDVDVASGMVKAVEHLAAQGHRRVLWAGPSEDTRYYPCERRKVFLAAVRECGMCVTDLRIDLPFTPIGMSVGNEIALSRGALLDHFRSGGAETAVVCYHEPTAIGAYAAATEVGWRVPDDLSVIGFDDVMAQLTYPPMTVVSHMLREVSDRAVEWATQMVSSREAWASMRHRRERIASQLIVRDSTAPAPAARRPTAALSPAGASGVRTAWPGPAGCDA